MVLSFWPVLYLFFHLLSDAAPTPACMPGLWEMKVRLSHEICCAIPQTNDEEVAARNNYNLSQISRAALAAETLKTLSVRGRM